MGLLLVTLIWRRQLHQVEVLTADMDKDVTIDFDDFKALVRGEKGQEPSAPHRPGSNGRENGNSKPPIVIGAPSSVV